LLVVVAIIAMLISILLPSLSRAREQAKAAKCGVNLRSLGQAVQTCYIENKDYGPTWDDGEAGFGFDGFIMYTWVDVLFDREYLGDYKAGICPTDERPDEVTLDRAEAWRYDFVDDPGLGQESNRGVRTSYALNHIMHFNYKRDRWAQDPTKQVYAIDGWWTWFGCLNAAWLWKVTTFGDQYYPDPFGYPNRFGSMVGWRHGYVGEFSANTLFMDGHVDLVVAQPMPTANQLKASQGAFDTNRAFTWLPGELPHRNRDAAYNGEIEDFHQPARWPFRGLVREGKTSGKWIGAEGADNDNVHPRDYPSELSALYRTQRNLWRKLPSEPADRN
jgi:prepilin-type processing-associated H-X9-DG protein